MERQQFLKSLGISFATVCAGACISSCHKDEITKTAPPAIPPPTEPPLPANTVSAKFTDFPKTGKTLIVGNVLFIRIADGNLASSFIAVQPLCPHNGGQLYWNKSFIECGLHGARYDTMGAIKEQPRIGGGTTFPLKTYPITVTSLLVNAKTK
jgi:cytochrome b6-f complex iron-sulfur subunit